MNLSLVFSDTNITSADATAILTFIQTTLSAGYTVDVLEIHNSGHLILKVV